MGNLKLIIFINKLEKKRKLFQILLANDFYLENWNFAQLRRLLIWTFLWYFRSFVTSAKELLEYRFYFCSFSALFHPETLKIERTKSKQIFVLKICHQHELYTNSCFFVLYWVSKFKQTMRHKKSDFFLHQNKKKNENVWIQYSGRWKSVVQRNNIIKSKQRDCWLIEML